MKYKLVISDVDGTLITPCEQPAGNPPQNLINMVDKIGDLGVRFTVSTARSLSWVENLVKGLKLKTPLILDNGAKIYDPVSDRYLRETYLDRTIANSVIQLLQREGNIKISVVDDGVRLYDVSKITKWKLSKIMVLGIIPKKAKEIYNLLKDIGGISVTRSVSGTGSTSQSIHVTDKDATKEKAVEYIYNVLGIKKAETIGIGDSLNDLSMLKVCGVKIAMGNSLTEVKEIADFITEDYKHDGVIRALEKYIINENI